VAHSTMGTARPAPAPLDGSGGKAYLGAVGAPAGAPIASSSPA